MIPGTRKGPLAQRLYRELASRLADRLGCCPIHGTRLICSQCDVVWTASAAESLEVDALLERSAVSREMTWPSWPCARCGAQDIAMCLDCYDPVADQAFAGLTPEEAARCGELLRTHLRFTCMRDPDDDGDPLHEGGPHAVRRS
jgi:hypothetical protein